MTYDFNSKKPTLQTLKDAYSHTTEKVNPEKFEFDKSVYQESTDALKKAVDAGDIADKHYMSKSGKSTTRFQSLVDTKEELEKSLEAAKADRNNTPRTIEKYQGLVDKQTAEITKHHVAMENELAEAKSLLTKARMATTMEKSNVLLKLETENAEALQSLTTAHTAGKLPVVNDVALTFEECKARLDAVHTQAKAHAEELYKPRLKAITEREEQLNEVAEKIESVTGKKVDLNKKLGSIVKDEKLAEGAEKGKFFKQLFTHEGAGSTALKVAMGVALVYAAVRALSPNDPVRQELGNGQAAGASR